MVTTILKNDSMDPYNSLELPVIEIAILYASKKWFLKSTSITKQASYINTNIVDALELVPSHYFKH